MTVVDAAPVNAAPVDTALVDTGPADPGNLTTHPPLHPVSQHFLLVALALFLLLASAAVALADEPVRLTHGINITGWFRFPVSRRPADLASYMSDQALADLRAAGFDFVRLAIDPVLAASAADRALLTGAIERIQRHGFAVVVSPHPQGWHLEADAADRDRLRDFWHGLARALRPLDPALTIPEVLNEPVFPADPEGWAALQHQVLQDIRQVLPRNTVVLTGHDWGSIRGLLSLTPEADRNVLYSFHFYDPSELTSLAAYRPELDRRSLARLPFPVGSQSACETAADTSLDTATGDLMRYYCALHWDAVRLNAEFDQAAGWASLHKVRLLAGEFGASAAVGSNARLAWLRCVREGLDARGIGWALWGYDDMMGLAVSRPPASRPVLDHDVLAALGMTTPTLSLTARSATYLGGHDR